MQIEQIDRDAARQILAHLNSKGVVNTPLEAGKIVEAFARHRLTALSARPAVGEDVVERVTKIIQDTIMNDSDYDGLVYLRAARAAIAAITGDDHG